MYLGGVCFITDRTISKMGVEEQVRTVLDAGIRFIQYREKDLARGEIMKNAEKLRKLTERYGAKYIVNDHSDIALAVDADGVHLGQDDLQLEYARRIMGERIIGVSTHDLDEAMSAADGGADYIGFGPIYYTTTKDVGAPKGPVGISEIRHNVDVPIVAIGGISHDSLDDIFRAGADAVALASSILRTADPYNAAKKLMDIVRRVEKEMS